MNQEQKFKIELKTQYKNYIREALNQCIKCFDAEPDEQCSKTCSEDYIIFRLGKDIINQKLNECLTIQQSEGKKNECYISASKNLESLIKFINRTKSFQSMQTVSIFSQTNIYINDQKLLIKNKKLNANYQQEAYTTNFYQLQEKIISIISKCKCEIQNKVKEQIKLT